ncbi:hypothetical protein ElyMa_000558700 [Elysia marginata]|uniref:Uncharacterized protein n=1 Tax=Elysia marginata TaxID=1093978 RepID=A0AAV4G4S9_9GAST|nr:hypothetical protein ElyMa_000558700 [Elysia marginata]
MALYEADCPDYLAAPVVCGPIINLTNKQSRRVECVGCVAVSSSEIRCRVRMRPHVTLTVAWFRWSDSCLDCRTGGG